MESNPKASVLLNAEDIFENMFKGNSKPEAPRGHSPFVKAPEIKHVKLTEDVVSDIYSSFGIKTEPIVEETIAEEVVSQHSQLEGKLESLINRLATLIKEAKGVIEEMTTCGMIGTSQKFALGNKKKKNGIVKSNKRN